MTKRDVTVLVLGVGGNIGQGILKALAYSSLRCRVIGACVEPLAMGLYTVDKAYVSPTAADPGFPEWLERVCRDEHVDAVLSGVEPVMDVLSTLAAPLRKSTGAISIVSAPEILAVGRDKYRTCQWLQEHGFNYPGYARSSEPAELEALVREAGFPLIAKPRFGKGSEGVVYLGDEEELAVLALRKDYVVQEHVGTPAHEYTVGAFVDRDGEVRGSIAMRRDLHAGTTYRAELGDYPDARAEAVRIVQTLRPMGPCNVQLRLDGRRAVCFEINVRFSGTTPIRAHYGWNDVEAAICHFVLGQPAPDLPRVTSGIAMRYWNEVYIDPEAASDLKSHSVLDAPQSRGTWIERYGVVE